MKSIILQNKEVLLRRMTLDDVEGIFDVAVDERIWTYTHYGVQTLSDARFYVEDTLKRAESGLEYPFVIIDKATDKIVGSTRFYSIDETNKRVEIGFTWITPSYWRTATNTNCKYLLLAYCFEKWGLNRVQIVADERNTRSCNAILRIGAKSDGVLRKHMICKDGFVRNTAVFSVIQEEWQETKAHLQNLLVKASAI